MNFFPFMFTEHEWELFGSLGVSEGGVSSHVCSLKKILFLVVLIMVQAAEDEAVGERC